MISWYSFFTATIFLSVMLAAVRELRRHTKFLVMYDISLLLFMPALALLRIILPLDISRSHVITSSVVLPAMQNFLRTHAYLRAGILTIWGMGAEAVLMRDFLMLRRAYRECAAYIVVEDERVRQIAEKVHANGRVLVSPDVPIPFVAGLFRHTIYIPEQVVREVPDETIELLLLHEMQHISSRDAFIKLLAGIMSAFFWWNPITYKLQEDIDAVLEMRCDAKVTEKMDMDGRERYAQMLLAMAKRVVPSKNVALPLNNFVAFRASNVFKQRFELLVDGLKKDRRRAGIGIKCCLLLLFIFSYMLVLQPISYPPSEELENIRTTSESWKDLVDEVTINPENAFIYRLNDRYYVFINGIMVRELEFDEINNIPYSNLRIVEGDLTK